MISARAKRRRARHALRAKDQRAALRLRETILRGQPFSVGQVFDRIVRGIEQDRDAYIAHQRRTDGR